MNTKPRSFSDLVIRMLTLMVVAPLFAIDKEGRQMFVDLVEWEFSCNELNRARGRIQALEMQLGELVKDEEQWRRHLNQAWDEGGQVGMW